MKNAELYPNAIPMANGKLTPPTKNHNKKPVMMRDI